MQNFAFLFAAFTIIWLAMLLYSFSIGARQKSLEREIESLKSVLAERESSLS